MNPPHPRPDQELREFVAERAELRGPGLLTQKEWDAVAAESKRRLLGLRLPLLETLKILMDWVGTWGALGRCDALSGVVSRPQCTHAQDGMAP